MIRSEDSVRATNGPEIESPGNSSMVNYLIKMKSDTSHFGSLEISKYFNFCEKTKSDPFLLTAGLNHQTKALA